MDVFNANLQKKWKILKQVIIPKNMIRQILVKFHDNPLSAHPGFLGHIERYKWCIPGLQ